MRWQVEVIGGSRRLFLAKALCTFASFAKPEANHASSKVYACDSRRNQSDAWTLFHAGRDEVKAEIAAASQFAKASDPVRLNTVEKIFAEFVDMFLDHSRVARRHYLVGQTVPKFHEAVILLGNQLGLPMIRRP